MIPFLIISGLLLLIYISFFLILLTGSRTEKNEDPSMLKSVSIIIVGRNEEHNVGALVHSIKSLEYPPHLIEVLFLDDNSEDRTLPLMQSVFEKMDIPAYCYSGKLLSIEGKKNGSAFLASQAKNEWLLFTDADVIVPKNWVRSMVNSAVKDGARMVCGPVVFSHSNSMLSKLYSLEFAALIQTSLMAIQCKFPFMCNAANMMVEREVYLLNFNKTGEKLSSGDDVFLLKTISETYGAKSIVANFDASVVTFHPDSLKIFFSQRIRWAGKSSKLFFARSFFVSLMVFGISCSLLGLLTLSFLSVNYILFGFLFLTKWMIDVMVLKRYSKDHKLFNNWGFVSLLLSFVYPFYVVSIALLSLKRTYLWKGRVVK